MTIIVMVAAASGPAFMALMRDNHLGHAVHQLSGIMEGARQYAITHNTPVWMVVSEADPEEPDSILNVGLVASRTGDDPVGWTSEVISISNHPELELVGNIQRLAGVKITKVNTSSDLPSDATDSDARQLETVQWDISAGGRVRRFTHALKFTPTGEVRVNAVCRAVEFSVAPLLGKSSNTATIRAGGVTGKISVIRPE